MAEIDEVDTTAPMGQIGGQTNRFWFPGDAIASARCWLVTLRGLLILGENKKRRYDNF